MILETLTYSVLSGALLSIILSCLEGEELHSLKKDENGKRNPMLPYWAGLTLVHLCILFTWGYFLYQVGIIKIENQSDEWWVTIAFFVYYWIAFETFYYIMHRSQHKCRCFGRLTGHKGELSNKFHHGLKPPYGPDMISAFSAHPFDSFIVQLSGQSPWFWLALVPVFGGPQIVVSNFTYGITLAWLAFIGIRAHSRQSFGGKYHCMHHDNPGKGPYSFSGIFERLLCIKYD